METVHHTSQIYDPRVQYDNDDEAGKKSVVWGSQSELWARESVMKGQSLYRSPYHEGDPFKRKGNLVYQYTDDELQEIMKCAVDFKYFLKTYCKIKLPDNSTGPFTLRDYQHQQIDDFFNNKYVLLLWSRQSGKTIGVSLYILWKILFTSDFSVAILANKGATSGEVLSKIKAMYYELPFFLKGGILGWNTGVVSFDNGSKVYTGVTTLDSLNSKTVDLLYLDEFAFVGKGGNKMSFQQEFLANALPTISSKKDGQLIISSTPNGKDYFYDLYDKAVKGENQFKWSKVLWWQIPGRDEAWAKEQIGAIGVDKFRIQYECSFDSTTETLLSGRTLKRIDKWKKIFESDLYEDVLADFAQYLYWDPDVDIDVDNDAVILSVDIAEGLKKDYSVIQILRIEYDEEEDEIYYRQIGVWRSNEVGVEDLSRVVAELFNLFNMDLSKVLVEQNTYGELLFTHLSLNRTHEIPVESILKFRRNSEDKKKIKGLRINAQTKDIAVKSFKSLMDSGLLIVSDDKTISEITNFQKNAKGKYEASLGHDDTVTPLTNFAYFVQLSDIQFLNWIEDFVELNGLDLDPEDAQQMARTRSMSDDELENVDDVDLSGIDPEVAHNMKEILGVT